MLYGLCLIVLTLKFIHVLMIRICPKLEKVTTYINKWKLIIWHAHKISIYMQVCLIAFGTEKINWLPGKKFCNRICFKNTNWLKAKKSKLLTSRLYFKFIHKLWIHVSLIIAVWKSTLDAKFVKFWEIPVTNLVLIKYKKMNTRNFKSLT